MTEIVPKDHEEEEEKPDWASDPKEMGFLDHVEELRWTVIKPLAVFILTFVVAMIFVKDFKDILMYPLFQSLSEEQAKAFNGLFTRNMMGVFTAMLYIGLIVGVAVASPFFIYYGGKFMAPALTRKERRILIPGALAVLFLFLLGCSFAFFLLLPKAIEITIGFNEMLGFQIFWSPESYFGFMSCLVLGMGVAFQFPLVAIILVYLNIVTVQKLRSMRRVCILAFFIIAAFLTPPDPFTQVMMAVPMVVLYEIAIVVAALLVRKQRASEDALY